MKKVLIVALFALLFAAGLALAEGHESGYKMVKASGKYMETGVSAVTTGMHLNKSQMLRERAKHYLLKMPKTAKQWKEVREKFQQERQRVRSKVLNYIQEKKRIRAAIGNAHSPEEKLNLSKDYIGKGIDLALSQMEHIKTYIEANTYLNDSVKADILAKIDVRIEALNETKGKLETVESLDEMRDIMKSLRDEWRETKAEIKQYVGFGQCRSLEAIVQRSNRAAERLENISALKDNSNFQEALSEYKSKIAEAQSLLNDSCGSEIDADKLQEAKQSIIDAYKDLRKALAEVRKTVAQGRRNAEGNASSDTSSDESNETEGESA